MTSERLEFIKNLVTDTRHKRIIDELLAEIEHLQNKVRVSDIIIKDHWETMRELVSACDTVSTILIDSNAIYKIDMNEYKLLVVEPFKKALARAKGEER